MRELVLDTETTGLDFDSGDRIVEIGVIELENHIQTGKYFHCYINPERKSDPKAEKVHGLTQDFLSDKPLFNEIAEELVKFISNSNIIIHNAAFDVGFLNSELLKCNMLEINEDFVIDTLVLAKQKFIGQSVSLDALCRKYNIDISDRKVHGALKDAKLLSLVYLELIGGKQTKLNFNKVDGLTKKDDNEIFNLTDYYSQKETLPEKRVNLNLHDNQLHLESLKEIPKSIWEILKN
ncbi:DNA polymerase III subunit epsilon [Alphaproteobacteria bacterium]|nr:DNA polymerase III subunit epsilon [Alphaproteobacteria bacterium]